MVYFLSKMQNFGKGEIMKPEGWYTGIVHLWQLDPEKVYIDLEEPFKTKMFKTARQITKSWTSLAKAVGLKISAYYCVNQIQTFKRDLCCKLSLIIKLSKFLESKGYHEFSLKNIERHISKIKKMYGSNPVIKPKLPFDFNKPCGATLISAILHDGHFGRETMYTNTSLQLREKIIHAFKNIIGECRISSNKVCVRFPRIFGIILRDGIGLKPGVKVETNPDVPYFILNGNKSLVSAYLMQAFDDEGSVSNSNITLTLETRERDNPPNLLIAINNLLKKMGIEHTEPKFVGEKITKSGKIGYLWRIGIYGKRNLEKFAKEVGFSLEYKYNDLKSAIASIKRYKFGQGKAIQELLKVMKEIKKENGKITSTEISKRLKKNRSHVGNYLKKMCELRLLKKIKDSKPLRKGVYPAEYEVIV